MASGGAIIDERGQKRPALIVFVNGKPVSSFEHWNRGEDREYLPATQGGG